MRIPAKLVMMPRKRKEGFILFVVVTVILVIAILAFALSKFKSGAVEQLAKTIDQNRLAVLAQSANAEALAFIRSQVNEDGAAMASLFRGVFATYGAAAFPGTPIKTNLFSGWFPGETKKIAQDIAYRVVLACHADLVVYYKSPLPGFPAFLGYIEVTSRASHEDNPENMVEIKERYDVKLVDVRHFFDKYVFFTKNFCPDINNPNRRLRLTGLPSSICKPDQGVISLAYFGNRFYPEGAEFPAQPNVRPSEAGISSHSLWFDIDFEEHKALLGPLLGLGKSFGLQQFPDGSPNALCWVNKVAFKPTIAAQFSYSHFFEVPEIRRVYEEFVNKACNAVLGTTDIATGTTLKTKCNNTRNSSNTNSNSAAYMVADDFIQKVQGAKADQYGACQMFRKILTTCFDYWQYHYGYTTAAHIWELETSAIDRLPDMSGFCGDSRFSGIATNTDGTDHIGPYFFENIGESPMFNKERVHVGRMAQIYGASSDIPVLVEGEAYFRLFKIAYFDKFTAQFTIYSNPTPVPLNVPSVPLVYYRPKRTPERFLNKELPQGTVPTPSLSNAELKKHFENYLMSRSVDTVPLNSLLEKPPKIMDTTGNLQNYDPFKGVISYPQQKVEPGETRKSGPRMFRVPDYQVFSHKYNTPKAFLEQRLSKTDNVLYVDGMMVIKEGDLDLSRVEKFAGKGLILIGKGHCKLGNFLKRDGYDSQDTVRIILQDGNFNVTAGSGEVEIHASLVATTFIAKNASLNFEELRNQGSFFPNGNKVTILGNLVVDYLKTDNGSFGVPNDGFLEVVHDPNIYNPSPDQGKDPYRISISEMKTFFSMNAGEKSF